VLPTATRLSAVSSNTKEERSPRSITTRRPPRRPTSSSPGSPTSDRDARSSSPTSAFARELRGEGATVVGVFTVVDMRDVAPSVTPTAARSRSSRSPRTSRCSPRRPSTACSTPPSTTSPSMRLSTTGATTTPAGHFSTAWSPESRRIRSNAGDESGLGDVGFAAPPHLRRFCRRSGPPTEVLRHRFAVAAGVAACR
jgi:hypothetical protein